MSQEWSPQFKMLFWKILGLGLSELALQSSLKKHLREKLKKVDPHYFSILEGVYFLHFFPKIPLSASKLLKTEISPLKLQKGLKVDIF